jgi:hypothetical protein
MPSCCSKCTGVPEPALVLHFPPSAYRVVEGDELMEWQRQVQDRLGLLFDVGSVSGTGAAYRCDSDIE